MSTGKDREILLERVRDFEKRTGHTVDSYPDYVNNTASILKEKRYLSKPLMDEEATRRMSMKSRRGFLAGGAAVIAGIFGWRWMSEETKAKLYKNTFRFNERVSQVFYSPKRLAPEFTISDVTRPARYNGGEGMTQAIDAANWKLNIGGLTDRTDDLVLTLDEIKGLPRVEMVTELKCIEGWSTIVHWAGARFSDFVDKYYPGGIATLPSYVSLTTPDELYYVGWDTPSILHPQTLLAYEMNGAPLTPEHGAPLRIASPTKYGIKLLKRIGRIEFTTERPRDFWEEPKNGGYDWYSGH